MDGNPRLDATIAYISRLTGQDISADQRIGLRSIQRVALASWARQEHLQVRGSLINSGTPFSVRELLEEGEAVTARPVGDRDPIQAAAPLAGASWGGVGLDIEDVASLPEAEDYREHFFYRDNFSPAEIAHCLLQGNVRASFCGIWAAKEAILKSELKPTTSARLIDIQITYDDSGRPTHPSCYISISHTAHTAVAVCLPKPAPALTKPALPMPASVAQAAPAASPPRRASNIIAALIIIAAICAASVAIFRL
jgi:phosphopantetheine--protein transferase-like protein